MTIIAIDPGNCTGYAVFEGKKLIIAGLLHYKKMTEDDYRNHIVFCSKFGKAFVEMPRVYPRDKWKGDPNWLIGVAKIGGEMAGRITAYKLQYLFPRQWKGQRSKFVDNTHTLKVLDSEELLVLEKGLGKKIGIIKKEVAFKKETDTHNMLDAVGIGLWALKRKKKGR